MKDGPSISVVVPTFERRMSLSRLLDALGRQTHPLHDLEVIVVDDGSGDGTPAWLRLARTPYRLRCIDQSHAGPAAARNRGVGEARGDVIIFLDDDVVPEPELVAVHAATHEARPDSVVVGPMLPPDRWRRPSWIRWEEERLRAQYKAMMAGIYPCSPRQFFTGNASLSRRRFLASGGFDVAFLRAEDVELGLRLARLGMPFVFEPRARVRHFPRRSFAAWQRIPYEYGQSDVAMARDKGHWTLAVALREFHERDKLNRGLTRICIGRPFATGLVSLALRSAVHACDAVGAQRAGSAALSALFHLRYWQGASDAMGGREAVWRALTTGATTTV